MSNIINYSQRLKINSRQLRKQGVLSEVILWGYLKNRKIRGFVFTRQKPIDNYIVDFYCSALKLVIEIDGLSHAYKVGYDEIRQKRLETLGLTVLHFRDTTIKQDIDSVLRGIDGWIRHRIATYPVTHERATPLKRGINYNK